MPLLSTINFGITLVNISRPIHEIILLIAEIANYSILIGTSRDAIMMTLSNNFGTYLRITEMKTGSKSDDTQRQWVIVLI